MTPPIPTVAPTQFPTGSTVVFTQVHGDYDPGDGWVMKWALAGAGQTIVTASNTGGLWQFTLTATLNTLAAGTYTTVLYIERTSPALERYELARGTVEVQANPLAASAGNQRLTDEAELALLDTAIAARIAGDVTEYTIGDRSLKKIPLDELLSWRNTVRSRLARRRRGGAFGVQRVSFGRVG
jgi:hypothetical protein